MKIRSTGRGTKPLNCIISDMIRLPKVDYGLDKSHYYKYKVGILSYYVISKRRTG